MKEEAQFLLALFSTKYFQKSAAHRDECPVASAKRMLEILTTSGADLNRLIGSFIALSDTNCVWSYTYYDELVQAIHAIGFKHVYQTESHSLH